MDVPYQITPKDFLYQAEEIKQFIQLVRLVQAQGDSALGFTGQVEVKPIKTLRGYVLEQKQAHQTPTGWVQDISGRVANISSLDLSKEDLQADTRILMNGQLFRHTHLEEYTHRDVSVYHKIKLEIMSEADATTGTLDQPDSTLDYKAALASAAPALPMTVVTTPTVIVPGNKLLGF